MFILLCLTFGLFLSVLEGIFVDIGFLCQELWLHNFVDETLEIQRTSRLCYVFIAHRYHLRPRFDLHFAPPPFPTLFVAVLRILRQFSFWGSEESVTVFIGWGRIGHFELIFKLDIICVLGVLFVLVCEELRVEVVLIVDLIVLAFLHVFIWYLSEYIGRGRTVVVNIDCVYVLLDWLS